MVASTALIALFLVCNNPLAFQQHDDYLAMAITVVWADPGLIGKYQVTPERMASVLFLCAKACGGVVDDQDLVLGICLDTLGDIQLLLNVLDRVDRDTVSNSPD